MLDRVLKLLDSAPPEPDVGHGYLDLLGEVAEAHDTVAQRLMRSAGLPQIYERVWRPVLFGLSKGGPLGPGAGSQLAGTRMPGPRERSEALAAAGCSATHRRSQGRMQFAGATRR